MEDRSHIYQFISNNHLNIKEIAIV